MTDKELLYVQDALGHEQYFQTQCREAANQLQDAELRSFAQQLEQQHKNVFQNLYNLLYGGYYGRQKFNGKHVDARKRRVRFIHARKH